MTVPNVFPHRFYAHDYGTYVSSNELSKMIWMRIRSQDEYKNVVWYCTDLEVVSADSVRIYIHDMADSFYGGIGRTILEVLITDFTKEEQALLDQYLLSMYQTAAAAEYDRRENEKVTAKVTKIRKELFGI